MGSFRNNFAAMEEPEAALNDAIGRIGQAIHPIVRTHPETGEEGLFVNRMFVHHIEGMSVPESNAILGHLYEVLEKHEFSCRFRWQPGGVLMWDNRFTLHYPLSDNRRELRMMIRTTCLES